MTDREKIIFLLERYVDVQPGLVDTYGGEGGALHTAGCWKHHSYRQLEELCGRLRNEDRSLYWHLAETYFRAERKRASYCPRCRDIGHASLIGKPCAHGQRGRREVSSDTRIPTIARVVKPGVEPARVDEAVGWIVARWKGDIVIPVDLKGAA